MKKVQYEPHDKSADLSCGSYWTFFIKIYKVVYKMGCFLLTVYLFWNKVQEGDIKFIIVPINCFLVILMPCQNTPHMMTSWNGNIYRVTGHLCGEFTEIPTKSQWPGAFIFSLICVLINSWVKNREGGNLRGYRAHYDVSIMNGQNVSRICWSMGNQYWIGSTQE